MGNPTQIAESLHQLERMTAGFYGFLDEPLGRLRLETLNKFRLKIEANLAALGKLLRMQSDAVRASLVEPHLAALQAIKLFRDDLFLVSLELVRAMRKPQLEAHRMQSALVNDYDIFLRNWIAASPILHPETAKWHWPQVRNVVLHPMHQSVAASLKSAPPKGLVPPLELARSAIQRESGLLLTDPKVVAISRRTIHLIGIANILAQVELAMYFSIVQAAQHEALGWYGLAEVPAGIIAELLGCLDAAVRAAVRDGDPLLRDKLERARREMLSVLALNYSVPARECATLLGFFKGSDKPNEVVGVNNITEKVTMRAGLIREDRPQARDVMLGYMANTGFPLVYPHRDAKAPIRATPRFGRVARAVQFRALREFVEHEDQAVFSFAETVAEQHELIADLLAHEPVRKAFAAALKLAPSLDLVNRTTRGRALAAVMQSLGRQFSPQDALVALIPMIQRYLTYFTRHTGDNIRDTGTPYLASSWPTDLNGRQFFDCGVYAVETAFDLMRAANAIKGLTLEFRFLLFPEHICLVVYESQTTFAVNNARIFLPRPFPSGAAAQARDTAGFSWAPVAMVGAFGVRFAIVKVALHPRTLSSKQSETAFKTAIFAMYQSTLGLGLSGVGSKPFFDSTKTFDAGSALLAGFILEIIGAIGKPASKAELVDSWNRATDLAEKLYLLAGVIADPCNYGDSKNVGFIGTIGAHVRSDDALVALAKLKGQLPMYEFVRLLNVRKSSGHKLSAAQQQLAKLPIGKAHVDGLSMLPAKCDVKAVQALAGAHSARQGEIAKLIKEAPPRILERIKAAGSALS